MKQKERLELLSHCLRVTCEGPVMEELSHGDLKYAVRKMFWIVTGCGQTKRQSEVLQEHADAITELASTTRDVIREREEG